MNTKTKIFVIENIILLSLCLIIAILGALQGMRIVLLTGSGVFGLTLSIAVLFLNDGKKISKLIGIYAAGVFFFVYVLNYFFLNNTIVGLASIMIFSVILVTSLIINMRNMSLQFKKDL